MSDSEYSSPACLMREVERLAPPKSGSWEDIKVWRKQQRDVLIKARPQDPNERLLRSAPILEQLSAELRAISAVPRSAAARLAEGGASGTSATAAPSATAPSATAPSATAPSATAPSATAPSATARSATAPSATARSATAPLVTAPSAAAPSAAAPSATAPSATAPSATAASGATRAAAVVLGIYWPFRGEIDVRDVAHRHIEAGGIVALPVVVEKNAPVEFWRWRPEVPMSRGLFNIPVPAERELVAPDVLIVPLVGFDRAGYRLGYGGGYYDRTLAATHLRPRTLAIAFAEAELETIYPQPHDIRMSRIITDRFAFDAP